MAQAMLQGITQEISIATKGNTRFIIGKIVIIEDSLTKLVGSFYIELDEHEWDYGQYRNSMTVLFDNT